MNPLQKKCVMATAGFHLLLVVILFLGPGFFRKEPKTDTLPVLKVIPLGAIEAALTSGAAAATPPPMNQPPPPPPPVQQPVTPTPPPSEPKPVVTQPVEPTPEPVKPVVPKPVEPKVEEPKPAEPEAPDDTKSDTPDPIPQPKPKPHKIVVDLTPVEQPSPTTKHPRRDTSHADEAAAEERAQERADRLAARKRAQAIREAAESLDQGLSSTTKFELGGTSSVATANYGQIVKSIYYNAWRLPDSADSAEASPRVRIVVARDGSVISAHIIEPSGDAAVDASVQRALDSVTFIQPFAESAREKERTFTIKFDAQTKRML